MKWLKMLRLLLSLYRKIDMSRLADLPDLKDSADTKAWLTALLEGGEALADLTKTDFDDQLVATLQKVVADDEAWKVIHGLILAIIGADEQDDEDDGSDDEDYIVFSPSQDADIKATADRLGISPLLIITLIQAAVAILKFLRERRAG